jgi:hypothetical protein
LILTEPRGLVPCHRRSWGFCSPGLSPPTDLLRVRHPKIPSRRSPMGSDDPRNFRASGRAPRALHPVAVRCLQRGIAPTGDPVPSRAFSPPRRHLANRLGTRAQEAEPRGLGPIRS